MVNTIIDKQNNYHYHDDNDDHDVHDDHDNSDGEVISNSLLESSEESSSKNKIEQNDTTDSQEETIDSTNIEEIKESSKEDQQTKLLEGGSKNGDDGDDGDDDKFDKFDNYEYKIDYLVNDDEKLINPENVFKQADIYIKNYNSPELTKYNKEFKQLYQKYSDRKFIIKNIIIKNNDSKTLKNKIIVMKNDKTDKIVYTLTKPNYFYYNKDNSIYKLKLQISNARTELLYKYEQLIAKLNVTPEDKTQFEKERTNFIELLETYYTYTLYHNKINKITNTSTSSSTSTSTNNTTSNANINTVTNIVKNTKTNIMLQKPLILYKEKIDTDKTILNSNIYSIDTTTVETINKLNSDNLVQYNDIILTLSSKQDKPNSKDSSKDTSKDKKINEAIKSYIDNKHKITLYNNKIYDSTDVQDKYIDYIILDLPK